MRRCWASSLRGVALQPLGRLEQAASAYQQAVALATPQVEHLPQSGSGKALTTADPPVSALEALAQEVDTFSEEEQIALAFALGKALADLKQPERAFHHLLMGNELKRGQVDYNDTQTLNLFARIQAAMARHCCGTRLAAAIHCRCRCLLSACRDRVPR
jgi:hypothetical protein